MRSDMDHREQLDDFSEFMKQKLEDHRLPVDDLCWEDIEPRMKPRGQKWLWWAGSSVAAAVIALLFLFSPFRAGDGSYDGVVPPVASVQMKRKYIRRLRRTFRKKRYLLLLSLYQRRN